MGSQLSKPIISASYKTRELTFLVEYGLKKRLKARRAVGCIVSSLNMSKIRIPNGKKNGARYFSGQYIGMTLLGNTISKS
jgi:hypothetical protein